LINTTATVNYYYLNDVTYREDSNNTAKSIYFLIVSHVMELIRKQISKVVWKNVCLYLTLE